MTRSDRIALWCTMVVALAALAAVAFHWCDRTMLSGAGSVPYRIARGEATSAVVTFGSPFDRPPVVMITSTSTIRDVVVSVGQKTDAGFEVVLAASRNSSAPLLEGTYTFDWVAIAR